jgi:hypothetical protein
VFQSWRESLAREPGREPRILAWAVAAEGFCIGSPAALSYQRSGARFGASEPAAADEEVGAETSGADGWTHLGWDEIEHGGWNRETRKLSWTRYDRHRGSVELTDPARIPELFRERVAASIVVERFIPVVGERGVTVSGRRSLAASDPAISWHASPGRGVTWQTPGLRDAADAAIAQLRMEYDPGR